MRRPVAQEIVASLMFCSLNALALRDLIDPTSTTSFYRDLNWLVEEEVITKEGKELDTDAKRNLVIYKTSFKVCLMSIKPAKVEVTYG